MSSSSFFYSSMIEKISLYFIILWTNGLLTRWCKHFTLEWNAEKENLNFWSFNDLSYNDNLTIEFVKNILDSNKPNETTWYKRISHWHGYLSVQFVFGPRMKVTRLLKLHPVINPRYLFQKAFHPFQRLGRGLHIRVSFPPIIRPAQVLPRTLTVIRWGTSSRVLHVLARRFA